MQHQASAQAQYFSSLLQAHSGTLCQVQRVVESQTQKFQTRIQNGRYQIRESSSAVPNKSNPNSTTNLKDLIVMKQNLESKLDQLESNLQQLQNDPHSQPAAKLELTKEQHDDFMKQLVQQNKQFLQRKIERREKDERRSRERDQEQRKLEDASRIEKEKKRKEEIEEKLRLANQVKERRQKELDSQNKVLSSLMQSKPLYEKLEDGYSKVQLGALEEKKRRLAQIRSFHKPISKEELDEHQKKFEALKEKKQLERQQRYSSQDKGPENKIPEVYRSLWHKKILLEEAKTQQNRNKEEQDNQDNARQLRQKLKQYSQYVKANFKPQVDTSKSQELKMASSQNLKIEVRPEQIRRIGLDYLKFSKQHANPNKAMTELNSTTSNPGLPPRPPNYLEELRKNRVQNNYENSQPENKLEKIISKPMEQKQKAKLIIEHVAKLEQMAKRKQQLAKASGQPIDQELDQIYLDTAKAKLALLN